MVDIMQHRAAIGKFLQRSRQRRIPHSGKQKESTILTLVILISLALWTVQNDPGIEKNPGPTMSDEERNSFKIIRSANSSIAQAASQRYYLSVCKDLSLIPRVYRVKETVVTPNPNPTLLEEHAQHARRRAFEKMDIDIAHDNKVLPELINKKTAELKKLHSICIPEQYASLSQKLEELFQKEILQQQECKSRKLDRDTQSPFFSQNSTSNHAAWNLISEEEMQSIVDGSKLCDNITTAAMRLVMQYNPLLQIQPTSLNSDLLQYCPSETIHIHHNGADHFVTSSSIGGEVKLYDSLNISPTEGLFKQLSAL